MYTHTLLNKLLAHLNTLYPYASTHFIRWSQTNLNIQLAHLLHLICNQTSTYSSLQLFKCISYSMKNMIYNNTITILVHHTHKCWLCSTKTTYCNKTIISSKLFNAKCYFNYVINIILQLATYNYVYSFYTWLCSPQACNNHNNNKHFCYCYY